jgi:hypothetical protein
VGAVLQLCHIRTASQTRAGAARRLATLVHAHEPNVLAIGRIDPGDALALATRFAMDWAYRGGQAIFWRRPFEVDAVHDYYQPAAIGLALERRGLVVVESHYGSQRCILAATAFGRYRDSYVFELRFTRARLRGPRAAVLFAELPRSSAGIEDLGFRPIAESIYIRGFAQEAFSATTLTI